MSHDSHIADQDREIRSRSEEQYRKVQEDYRRFANQVKLVLEAALTNKKEARGIASVEARAKDVTSFGKKSIRRDSTETLKYPDPIKDIIDLAGVRVITIFEETSNIVSAILDDEFEIVRSPDDEENEERARKEDEGYRSRHYVVRMKEHRLRLPEYEQFKDKVAEVQVRTALQHAWAQISHHIQYKDDPDFDESANVDSRGPDHARDDIRRGLRELSGLIGIGDREFGRLKKTWDDRTMITDRSAEGTLEELPLNVDNLKNYLDEQYGADSRVATYRYEETVQLLAALEFRNIEDVAKAITPYNDDKVSRILHGGRRQGQLQRFEDVVLASMGEGFIDGIINAEYLDEYVESMRENLATLRSSGTIRIGDYTPGGTALASSTDVPAVRQPQVDNTCFPTQSY